jgi:hypothetical protein
MRAAHGRIERGNESSRRLLDLDPALTAHVLVRLAVRDEYELAIVQIMNDVNHQTVMSQQQPCPVRSQFYLAIAQRSVWNTFTLTSSP